MENSAPGFAREIDLAAKTKRSGRTHHMDTWNWKMDELNKGSLGKPFSKKQGNHGEPYNPRFM